MNLEEGIHKLNQLFMSANDYAAKEDYHSAINEYNKIIALCQDLRKPFDNGEVPLNIVMKALPRILQAEQTAKSAIEVATLTLSVQQKSQTPTLDNITDPEIKKYTQLMLSATENYEKHNFDAAIDKYIEATEIISNFRDSINIQYSEPSTEKSNALQSLTQLELNAHKGLYSAYCAIGNSLYDTKKCTQLLLSATEYYEKNRFDVTFYKSDQAIEIICNFRDSIKKQYPEPSTEKSNALRELTQLEISAHKLRYSAYCATGDPYDLADAELAIIDALEKTLQKEKPALKQNLYLPKENPAPTQNLYSNSNQYNAQAGGSGCFSEIFIMCAILSVLLIY